MDFVSGLVEEPVTRYAQTLVLVDKFTKYVMLEPCTKGVTAVQMAQIFVRRIIGDHGVPAMVISDRGPQFTASIWKEILKSFGARAGLAATHYPQMDGQTERVIQTLSRLIRAYVTDQSSQWVAILPLFQFALNNSASAVTKVAPFQLLYAREPIAPMNLMLQHEQDRPGGLELGNDRQVLKWARRWWKARRKLCKFVYAILVEGAQRVKYRYDSKHKPFNAEPGDLVLLSVKSHPTFGEARKMRMRFTGLYVVKRKVHTNTYELEGLPPAVPPTQNVSFLRMFQPTPAKFRTRPTPGYAAGPIKFRDDLEWEVEAIKGHRDLRGEIQYQLKWRDHFETTWTRVTQMKNCQEMLREYQLEHKIPLSFWDEEPSSPESDSGDEEREDSDGEDPPLPTRDRRIASVLTAEAEEESPEQCAAEEENVDLPQDSGLPVTHESPDPHVPPTFDWVDDPSPSHSDGAETVHPESTTNSEKGRAQIDGPWSPNSRNQAAMPSSVPSSDEDPKNDEKQSSTSNNDPNQVIVQDLNSPTSEASSPTSLTAIPPSTSSNIPTKQPLRRNDRLQTKPPQTRTIPTSKST